jgi:hypothetical protein
MGGLSLWLSEKLVQTILHEWTAGEKSKIETGNKEDL